MGIGLQILLAGVAILTSFTILRSIRKSHLQIEYSFFWLIFSLILFVFAILPSLISSISSLLGFQSPSNFVFLVVIFLLIINQYHLTKIISKNEIKLRNVIQFIALEEKAPKNEED